MANSDKNLVITPNVGSSAAEPTINFSGADSSLGAQSLQARIYPIANGTLSFEGSVGQLFSITNNLTGTIYSVNDVSGLPSIEVFDSGIVRLARYSGRVLIGNIADNGVDTLQFATTGSINLPNINSTGNVTANTLTGGTVAANNLTSGRVTLANTAGQLTDDSAFTYDTSTDILTLAGTTDSSNSITGTLKIAGGVGIAKKLYVGTNIVTGDNNILQSGRVKITSNSSGGYILQNDNSPLYLGANTSYPLTIESGATAATSNVRILSNLTIDNSLILGNAEANDIHTIKGATTLLANSASAALTVTQTGAGNALLVEDSTNPDSTPFVIDSNGNVMSGYTNSINTAAQTGTAVAPGIQQHATVQGFAALGIYSWSSNAGISPNLIFSKSNSGTINTRGTVASGTLLGASVFDGDDGTNFIRAATIEGWVDGTPGTNDMPGRLVFSTTADGASSPTERMRIDSAGNVGIGTSSPGAKLDVSGTVRASNVITSTLATGTAPFTIASTTVVTNLNVDKVDGKDFGTFTAAGGIAYATSTTALAATAAGTAGQAVLSGGAGAPTFQTIASANGASTIVARDVNGDFTARTITATSFTEIVFALTGTTPAFTATNGAVQTWTLSAASTPTNALTSGQSIILVITPGAFSITWPSVVWTKQGGSGVAPTLFSAGKTSIVLWMVGAVLYGSHLGDTV